MRLDFYTPSDGRGTGAGDVNNVNRPSGVYQSGSTGRSHQNDANAAWSKQPRAQVSAMGLLMRELLTLKGENPEGFAAATSSIASNLRALADAEIGEAAERIYTMADRFELASEKGDLSALRPQPQPFGALLRGPSAYLQHSGDIQETRAEVHAVIRDVLDQYGSNPNSTSSSSQTITETDDSAQRQATTTSLDVISEDQPKASTTIVG